MRVLHLAQFYSPLKGGIERNVQDLGKELAKRGHDVSVATLWHEGLSDFEMDGDVRVHRIRGAVQRLASLFTAPERRHAPPFPDPESVAALRRVILQERPEIVHAHNWIVHSFLPLKLWSKAKLVMTFHDCEMGCVQGRFMYRGVELCDGPGFSKCMRCATHHYGYKGPVILTGNLVFSRLQRALVDMFLPVSTAVAEANQLTGTNLPYQVIPNFVSDDVADAEGELDERVAALPESGYILQVGDLTLDKGVGVLLDAYRGLEAPPPLVLIGWRLPDSIVLPPNVTVINGLPRAAVMQAWQKSLFGTVPSLCRDASPTVTLEAMASGKAVIGSQIGGITDQILDGETGFLVPPGDVSALRNAMNCLIKDPALRSRMGAAAKAKVIEFQSTHVIERIEKVYQQLICRRHSYRSNVDRKIPVAGIN